MPPKPDLSARLNLRLAADLRAGLDFVAAVEGDDVGAVARRAVADYLDAIRADPSFRDRARVFTARQAAARERFGLGGNGDDGRGTVERDGVGRGGAAGANAHDDALPDDALPDDV